MDANEFRKAAHAAIEDIISYNESLPDRNVLPTISPGYLRPQLPHEAPEDGESWSAVQADITRLIEPGLTHWQSPNFMAFFPALTSYPSMLGEMYSATFSAPAFNWLCSPACTELETVVLDWMGRALHLPACFLADESGGHGGGVIQGSASEAIVTVMVAARERYLNQRTRHIEDEGKRQDEIDRLRGKLVALGSEQAHSATHKAANITGVRHRAIPAFKEDGFAMRGEMVRRTLQEMVDQGLEPFYLTVGLGTTATCAIDAFEEVAAVMREWKMGDIWVHVDAAYAGAMLILDEYAYLAKQIEPFDSFNVNMHKWLLVNFDASCLWIRSRTDLTSALSITRSYLDNSYTDSGLVTDYRDWQIPLGRRFRALKIWFVLRTYGLRHLRAHVNAGIKRGELFAKLVRGREDVLKIVSGPAIGLTVVAVVPSSASKQSPEIRGNANHATPDILPNGDSSAASAAVAADASNDPQLEEMNSLTKEVYDRIFAKGEFYLTSGVVAGVFAIRVVACNPTTSDENMRRVFEAIVTTAEEVRAGR